MTPAPVIRPLRRLLLVATVMFAVAPFAQAQVSITNTNTPLTQDFNTLINNGSTTFAQNSTLPGWYAVRTGTATSIDANNGSGTAGGLYSFGQTSVAERALGSIGANGAPVGSFFWGVRLVNNTGRPLTGFALTYTGEQWRAANEVAQTVSFSYRTGASFTGSLAEFQAAGTAVATLDFTGPTPQNTGPVDGNLAANRLLRTATVTLAAPLAAGQELLLRWSDPNHTGTDHSLAIDDFSFTAIGPGVTIVQSGGSTNVSEAGAVDSYTLVLDTQPTADVTITITPDAQVTRTPVSVTFTNANWNMAQTIDVGAVDDLVNEGPHTGTFTHTAASADTSYNAIPIATVTANITDNDVPGVTIVESGGNTAVSEAGATDNYTLVLDSQPTADVTIAFNGGTQLNSPASITFTSGNWNMAQQVTVSAVNDSVAEGPHTGVIMHTVTSMDGNYNGLPVANVLASIADNDNAGITVAPLAGLVTTEAGGTATVTVVLTSQPTANVSIGLSSSDSTEGTVAPPSLLFDSLNWAAPQTVTVTGVNDFLDDGDIAYAILTAAATSIDANYGGLDAGDPAVVNIDNDASGITVAPTSGLVTTEAGGTATFTVVLTAQPTADVVIGLTSSDTTEGTVAPPSLTFTNGNWNMAQTVTVIGFNDFVDDGDIAYTIVTAPAASADPLYNALNASDVAASNTDNDAAGITVAPTAGLITSEVGGTATFTVVLTSQPTADVSLGLTSSDTTEGTVAPASLTFTSGNWSLAQTVTVTGADDFLDDGDIAYTIVTAPATSADPLYNALNASDVGVTNTDNDGSGFTIVPTNGISTTEAGGTAAFTVVLTAQPTADVILGLSSSDTTEGTVSPASLTFTNGNWNAAQTVTVTGVNDFLDDGDIAYSIVTAAATSADVGYSGLNPVDVSITNIDNDTAGFTVVPVSGLVTTEAGGTATFTVVLTAQPSADVVVGLTSSDTTEGTVAPAALTFTNGNWNAAQTVTVTGVDDFVDDGNIAYSIVTAPATSADPAFNALNPADVTASNTDNDTAGITVAPVSGLTTTEAGGTATFTIVLTSQPTADVTIGVSSSDTTEGTVGPASLTFTSGNWNVARTVTVTGVDDFLDDGNIAYTLVTAPALSGDPIYNGVNPADVAASNTDNDTAGFTVAPVSGLTTTEAGGTATFTVVLTAQPSADVVVGLTSSDTTEGTVAPASLTFTNGNWNVAQTVTVTGVNDFLDDGNIAYTIVTAPATSADPAFNALNPADVTASNTDNDTAGFTVVPVAGLITTEAGGTATFTVVLTAQPSADVSVGLTSTDTTEGTVAPATLTFTNGNWNVAQTVTVNGVDDPAVDGNIAYIIVTAAATSADPAFNALNPSDVTVTNTDNDTATLSINSISITEGTGTNPVATLTVTVSSPVASGFTVPYTTANGTAVAPGDYTTANGTLTFYATSTTATVQVTVIGDGAGEPSENFHVDLGTPSTPAVTYGVSRGTVTIIDDDTADLSITLTDAPDPVVAGTQLTYTATLSNAGTADAPNARITLPVPVGTTLVSATASAGGVCAGTTTVTCTWAGATGIGVNRIATVVVSVAPSATGTLSAAAAAASDLNDPNITNNTASATTTIVANANLALTLTASSTIAMANVPVTFTASSQNLGPSDAQNVQITLTLTPDFRLASFQPSAGATCTAPQVGNTGVITCTWAGATAPGATRTLAVTAYAVVAGTSTVSASTSSPTADPVSANNSASIAMTVSSPTSVPALDLRGLLLLTLLIASLGALAMRRQHG